MSRLDYKLLEALHAVIKAQSFDRAASELCLTQSAISQRIKQLEQRFSQPVLIRSQPIEATALGKALLQHYSQVVQLEADLLPRLLPDEPETPLTLHIATNADSLATWLIPAITPVINAHLLEVNMLVVDEQRTVEKLKDGEAFGAISVQSKTIKGCQLTRLGELDYILVASPDFIERYFPKGINKQSLRTAPGVAFDHKDNMHIRFIQEHFGLVEGDYPLHTVRSSEAFVALAKNGAAFCLIPKLQIESELALGELIHIFPEQKIRETLYWHHWVLLKGIYKQVSDAIVEYGQQVLGGNSC